MSALAGCMFFRLQTLLLRADCSMSGAFKPLNQEPAKRAHSLLHSAIFATWNEHTALDWHMNFQFPLVSLGINELTPWCLLCGDFHNLYRNMILMGRVPDWGAWTKPTKCRRKWAGWVHRTYGAKNDTNPGRHRLGTDPTSWQKMPFLQSLLKTPSNLIRQVSCGATRPELVFLRNHASYSTKTN